MKQKIVLSFAVAVFFSVAQTSLGVGLYAVTPIGSSSSTITVYDPTTGLPIDEFGGVTRESGLAFGPNGHLYAINATGSPSSSIGEYDPTTGLQIKSFGGATRESGLAFFVPESSAFAHFSIAMLFLLIVSRTSIVKRSGMQCPRRLESSICRLIMIPQPISSQATYGTALFFVRALAGYRSR